MDVTIVDQHPNGCIACHAVTGPFAVLAIGAYTVQTVEGPMAVDADVVFCAKRDGREGCVGQIARAAGYVAPDELENVRSQYAALIDRHGELEQAHAELKESKEIAVDELASKVSQKILEEAE